MSEDYTRIFAACERVGQGFPSQLDMQAVGNYLLGEGFTQDQVVQYKTNRAWDHKRGIHSVG